jgi:hypothetical protein
MAIFNGTKEDFIKFVGPYARNSVQNLSKKLKKSVGKCEECGSKTKKLDAAHRKGVERNEIIASILIDSMEENIVNIDLDDFTERFKAAHTPIEGVIKVLCKTCHYKYDKTNSDDYEDIEKKDIDEITKAFDSIMIKTMNSKKKAIETANKNGFGEITGSNSIFANVNSAVNVWWLEPDNQKFSEDLYLLLSHTDTNELFILKIPANIINDPETIFRQRIVSNKMKSSIEIVVDTHNKFIDRRSGFDFSRFFEKTVKNN